MARSPVFGDTATTDHADPEVSLKRSVGHVPGTLAWGWEFQSYVCRRAIRQQSKHEYVAALRLFLLFKSRLVERFELHSHSLLLCPLEKAGTIPFTSAVSCECFSRFQSSKYTRELRATCVWIMPMLVLKERRSTFLLMFVCCPSGTFSELIRNTCFWARSEITTKAMISL